MSDDKKPAATAVSQRLAPRGGGGGAWLGGPKTASSEKFGHVDKPDFHLFGTDLFGDEIKPDVKGALREKFEFPPFSVLNAREGPWQARKRAWLSCGIQSELGRGATTETITPKLEGVSGASAGLVALRAQQKATKQLIPNDMGGDSKRRYDKRPDASPGGSARPAMDYSNRERGDGAGKPIRRETASLDDGLAFSTTTNPYRKPGQLVSNTSSSSKAMEYAGGFENSGAGASGTSIFDPVLTELSYRWFCPPGGLILDPFAGGSVRGVVAGLLGFRYHGIDLRPEQVAANEVQRAEIVPEADIQWAIGDSNKMLLEAPAADMAFSCPPYADLEQYSDDPDDLSNMSWEKFSELYRAIICKTVDRMKSNTFAVFVVGEVRDKKTGFYRGLIPLTCECFTTAGAHFYNSAILVTAVGSLPIRITKQFESGRKLGTTHQHVLCFVKGDPKLACAAINGAAVAEPKAPRTVRAAAPARPAAPAAPAGPKPSAMAFVSQRRAAPEPEPVPAAPAPEPEPVQAVPAQPIAPAAVEPLTPDLSPAEVKLRLDIRGHRLLTRDGRFFVTEPERLTAEDLAAFGKMDMVALMAIADPWTEPPPMAPTTIVTVREPISDPVTLVDKIVGDPSCQSAGQPGNDASPASIDGGWTSVVCSPSPSEADRTPPSTAGDDGREGVGLPAANASESVPSSPNTIEAEREARWQENLEQASNASPGSLLDEPPPQTLAQFLGSEPPRAASSYVPDEPPNLTGINEIVLNFATDGVDWDKGHRPGGVTVSSMDGQLCRFLPFRFAGGNLSEEQVKRWAQEQLRGKKIYGSKTKFDIHNARVWGIDLEAQGCTFSDIQHTAALLDDHRKRFAVDLLAADYLPSLPIVARLDERQHLGYHAAEAAEREKFTASLVWRLRDVMYPQIDEQELRQVHDLEDAVIPSVVEMEKNGSPINEELLTTYGRECMTERGKLMLQVSKECGFAFEHTNAGWKRLIESLHLPMPEGFSEEDLDGVDHPLIRLGQRASQYAHLNSKVFKAYPEHIVDGILRYSINQLASDDGGTVSGRFSIGLVQQVPNKDNHEAAFGDALSPRRLFIPGPGALGYGEADAAQEEFRLLVHYTQNKKLLQAYRDDPLMSFHREMQKELVAYKSDMLYAHTKNYNFAAQYGARSIKLATMMKFITEKEGAEIRAAKRWDDPRLKLIKEIEAAYRQAHPEAGELLEKAAHLAKSSCDDFCKKGDKLHRQFPHRGFIKTLAGRRSRFPTNYKTYIALNRVLQGGGADIMKQKLRELHDARKETGFVMRITNHDAVLGDVMQPDTMAKVGEVLDRQSFPLSVPILWECKQGPSWGDCK